MVIIDSPSGPVDYWHGSRHRYLDPDHRPWRLTDLTWCCARDDDYLVRCKTSPANRIIGAHDRRDRDHWYRSVPASPTKSTLSQTTTLRRQIVVPPRDCGECVSTCPNRGEVSRRRPLLNRLTQHLGQKRSSQRALKISEWRTLPTVLHPVCMQDRPDGHYISASRPMWGTIIGYMGIRPHPRKS